MKLTHGQIENHRMTTGWTLMHSESFDQEKLAQHGLRRRKTIRRGSNNVMEDQRMAEGTEAGGLAGSAWAKPERAGTH
jgi:hypothetical protein